ncbi:MAG TPA: hypothetical protein VHA05_00210 [Candidatus Saccharimonadales bacterium]|nr:hypothetical protein [Candidatus Saccharimonadales bacterium]
MPTIGEVSTAEADIFEERIEALEALYKGLGHNALVNRSVAETARLLYERALVAIIDSGIVIEGLTEDSELRHVRYNPLEEDDEHVPLDAVDRRRLHQHFSPIHFTLSVPGITPEQDPESREIQPQIFFRCRNFRYTGTLDDIHWRRRIEDPEAFGGL